MFGLSLANANNKPLRDQERERERERETTTLQTLQNRFVKNDNLLEGKRKKIAVNCKHEERRLTKESDRRERTQKHRYTENQ